MKLDMANTPRVVAEVLRELDGFQVDYLGTNYVAASTDDGTHAQVIQVKVTNRGPAQIAVELIGLDDYAGESAWQQAARAAGDLDK